MTARLPLRLRTHGGRREGSGRPKVTDETVPHLARPPLMPRHPVHVTWTMRPHIPDLRDAGRVRLLEAAIAQSKDRFGMRLVHHSIQSSQLHLIVEAEDEVALGRALKGLGVRIARALNRALGTRHEVFTERYHASVLDDPAKFQRALAGAL